MKGDKDHDHAPTIMHTLTDNINGKQVRQRSHRVKNSGV